MNLKGIQIGVIGAGEADRELIARAESVGEKIAREGGILVCGGLGGVMEAACRGAFGVGGMTVGILPGADPEGGNPYLSIKVVTGMGHARNVILIKSCRAVIAVGGGHGTLSEIALALKMGIPVIGLGTWDIPGVQQVSSPDEALKGVIAAVEE